MEKGLFSGLSSRVFDVVIGSLKQSDRGFGDLLVGSPPMLDWAKLEFLYETDKEFAQQFVSPEATTRRLLARLALECASRTHSIDVARWTNFSSWTDEKVMMLVLRAFESDDSLFCALMCCTLLERGLCDLFSCLNKGSRPPPLFRDMMDHASMSSLGQGTILFLRALVGHPLGLNLRNIVW
jgi:hypothetical protein